MNIPIFKIDENFLFENCVLAYGHFNSVHHGHIRYLKHAAEQGDNLIVAILPDTKEGQNKNYQFSQKDRADALSAINSIKGILLLDDKRFALMNAIKVLKPNVLVLGTEFEISQDIEIIEAIKIMKKNSKSVQFHAGAVQYASTKLLDNSEKELLKENRIKFFDACKRQKINFQELIDYINSWKNTSLAVIGDTILDQYAGCEAVGMSAEAPVLVVRELQKKNFVGGASIVASHIKALGAKCHFLSVVGADSAAKIIKEDLTKQGISSYLIEDSSRQTTFKKRYLVENQKLFRVSRLNDHLLDKEIQNKLIKKLEDIAPKVKGVVISDFVYGVVTEELINNILLLAKKYNLKIFGDVQCSSQIGLVTKFKNFSLLCPNEREARIALQEKDAGLEALSNKLINITKSDKLIMKLGAQGFIAYDRLMSGKLLSQPFPALSVNPVDVSGAGDSLLALMSTSLSTSDNFMAAAALGACMSALAVENMGNKPISANSLKDFLINLHR